MLGHMRWLIFTLSPSLLLADVVELKTGERLEGTFKQANAAGVVIEVGGQAINMPLEKVRAIYFGATPSPQSTGPEIAGPREALQSLKALQSVTTIGVGYRDYALRVADTKVKVDLFIQSPQQKETPSLAPIRLAMRYYELAAEAWGSKFAAGADAFPKMVHVGLILKGDDEIANCSSVKGVVASAEDFYQKNPRLRTKTPEEAFGMVGSLVAQKPAILWLCASEKITEAEQLIK